MSTIKIPGQHEPGYARPSQLDDESLAAKFRRLADQWYSETAAISSTTDKVLHPAYQRIIGIGPAAVPLILYELQENVAHWFWALRSITEEDPVNSEDKGRMNKMAEAWINWGKEHKYI